MPDNTLSDVQRWVTLIDKLTIISYRLSGEEESFFRDEILPIFAGDQIPDCISSFESEHPWLLEFNYQTGSFASTTRRLQQDPVDVPDILSAYIWLQAFARTKRGMTASLQKENNDSTPNSEEKTVILNLSAHGVHSVYNYFTHWRSENFPIDAHDARRADWAKWGIVVDNMRKFGDMLPQVQGANTSDPWDTWTQCIERLRTKTTALSLSSDVRGRELQKTIEDLKKKNSDQERQIREYRSIVSDLSFRHLMEMLPIAAKAAGKDIQASPGHTAQEVVQEAHSHETSDNESTQPIQSSKSKKSRKKGKQPKTQQHKQQNAPPRNQQKLAPQWQDFWKTAWQKAMEGKAGKLNDLWKTSNDLRRSQILSEGDRIYGLLSANIHDFGNVFAVKEVQQDVIRRAILLALQPEEENIKDDGSVNWDKEQERFV